MVSQSEQKQNLYNLSNTMNKIDSKPIFEFVSFSDTKLPENILARYCFNMENVEIPGTELHITIPEDYWVFSNIEKSEIFLLSDENFKNIYAPFTRAAVSYSNFIQDSIFNDVEISNVVLEEENLFEASDLSEEIEFANWFGMQGAIYLNDKNKPCLNLAHSVDIEPLKLKDRVVIAWKILTNKNFKFDKVSMDWN
jgi:hypothetical protein